jgi:hypothetical protein
MLLGSTSTALAQEQKPTTAGAQEQKPTTPAGPQEQKPLRPFPKQEKPVFGPPPQKCPFDIIGTWKAQISTTQARLYTFDAEGVVKVFTVSGTDKPREIATASYELPEDPTAPKKVSFTATGKNRIFGKVKASMDVVSFDDSSITCVIPGAGTTRWTKVDPNRYFIVFVSRQ